MLRLNPFCLCWLLRQPAFESVSTTTEWTQENFKMKLFFKKFYISERLHAFYSLFYSSVFFSIEFDQNQLNCVYSVFHIAKCRPMSYISFPPLFDKCVWNEPVLSYFNKIRVYIETTIKINVFIFCGAILFLFLFFFYLRFTTEPMPHTRNNAFVWIDDFYRFIVFWYQLRMSLCTDRHSHKSKRRKKMCV